MRAGQVLHAGFQQGVHLAELAVDRKGGCERERAIEGKFG